MLNRFIIRLLLSILSIFSGIVVVQAQSASPSEQEKTAFKRPDVIPFPAHNPYTLEKATLGKMLFFDQRLSGSQNMSCATCHNPSFGWEVPFPTAIGAQNQPLNRHAPTVLGVAWGDTYFWDGRAKTLEEQAGGPIENPDEMNQPLDELVVRLDSIPAYQSAFKMVFPNVGVTEENIKKALATYQRTIVPNISSFDQWINGSDTAISDQAKRGFRLFTGKGQCASCHTGWNFTDHSFHDIGLSNNDIGRYEVDGSTEKNRYAFKTPSLRNLTQRAPFMHDGSVEDLDAVMAHYISGGIDRPSRSSLMTSVELDTDEVQDILAFLNTLTAENEELILPILPN
jgi:cytochrome c peroxidase